MAAMCFDMNRNEFRGGIIHCGDNEQSTGQTGLGGFAW